MRERAVVALSAIGAVLLAGCATEPAPVEDRSLGGAETAVVPVRARAAEGVYRVVRGDTLYSIAFKRGLDYRDVAAWNGIAAPYRILVDQELRLTPPGGAAIAARVSTASPPLSSTPRNSTSATSATGATTIAAAPAPASNTSMFEDVPASQYAPPPVPAEAPSSTAPAAAPSASTSNSARVVEAGAPAPAANSPAPPPVEKTTAEPPAAPIVASTPPPPPAVANPPVEAAPIAPVAKPDSASANVNGIAWRWPSTGKIVGSFVGGDQTKQGIDIAGSAGDSVRAAADGEVVYSGNGLIGYGELIIVKHNASFLSAYGHNRKRLVAEGDKVHAGQQIAEMGSSGAARDALHFEIRKNGKPVNPTEYLPAR